MASHGFYVIVKLDILFITKTMQAYTLIVKITYIIFNVYIF